MSTTTDNPDRRKPQRGRSGGGRFIRTDESAERDAEACRLRTNGATYRQIADQLGYADESSAWKAVDRALRATVAEPAAKVRMIELARLDLLFAEAYRVMRAEHVVVSNGRVVMDPADPTKPLRDDGPTLAAIDRLVKIGERRARLWGLDAPIKVDLPTYGQVEAEIARLATELGMNDPEVPA